MNTNKRLSVNRLLAGRVLSMAVETEKLDPETAVKTLVVSKDEDKIESGDIVATFSITVKDDDKDETVLYSEKAQPFVWNKIGYSQGLPEVFRALSKGKAVLTSDQVEFLGTALEDSDKENSPIGNAVKSLIDMYNSVARANAKQNEYARVLNFKKPITPEKRDNAIENIITNFMRLTKTTRESAIETLRPSLTVMGFKG